MVLQKKLTFISYCLVVCYVSLLVYVSTASAQEDTDVPVSKISQNVGVPTLKFLYCYSCGYRKMFDQYIQLINQKYPFILVDGANYDPPGIYMYLVRIILISYIHFSSKLMHNLKLTIILICYISGFVGQILTNFFTKKLNDWGTLKMIAIVCVLGGINIFDYFNQPQPSWWRWCVENKIYACMMLFFLCNLIEGQLVASGAFEIFLNDVPIWSKLESGRLPQPAELFQIIDSHMQFTDTKLELNGFAK